MKACVIQPPYSRDVSFSDEYFDFKLSELEKCTEELDLIVLPEYSDVPCATSTLEQTLFYHKKYIDKLLFACSETAKRCSAILCVNALSCEESGYRNTTYVYDREGKLIGKYFKKHLPPLELETLKLDSAYTFVPSEPYVLEIEGLRYAFLTCYDFYFYEAYARIAKENVDIIVGCSLQRSDSHSAIEIMCRHLAYNTNAYVVRSSVSFSEDSEISGASMIVDPRGNVLCNMRGRFGTATAEFDPKDKYYKPAGYGNPPASHYQYIEYGRKPWQYRLGGAGIVPFENIMPYPRLCAHRGINTVAPENSMPALSMAVGMGAGEIEFDLWPTSDGVIVSSHDRTLERVSTGVGRIDEHTYAELLELDFGINFSEEFRGLKVLTFEEILAKLGGRTIMNIHIKPLEMDKPYPEEYMKKIISLIRKYDCERHCYLMLEPDCQIKQFKEYAPDIPVCVGHLKARPWDIVKRAIALGAEKVQLFKPYLNSEMVELAHKHGIICNVFCADEVELAREYFDMGVDTVLTNRYNLLYREFSDRLGKL